MKQLFCEQQLFTFFLTKVGISSDANNLVTNAYSQPEHLEQLFNNVWAKLSMLVADRNSFAKLNTVPPEQGGDSSSLPFSARANTLYCSLQTSG